MEEGRGRREDRRGKMTEERMERMGEIVEVGWRLNQGAKSRVKWK